MSEPAGGGSDRPRWSFTWLLRIQRTGRSKAPPVGSDGMTPNERRMVGASRLFPWAVILLLLLEVGLLVWLGVLPR
jgi:hypothetical protein